MRSTSADARRRRILLAAGSALLPLRPPSSFGQTPAPAHMNTRPVPSTGEALPVVGCGTWRTFDVGDNAQAQAALADVLRILFDNGGSVIHSSPVDGSSGGVARAVAALTCGDRSR